MNRPKHEAVKATLQSCKYSKNNMPNAWERETTHKRNIRQVRPCEQRPKKLRVLEIETTRSTQATPVDQWNVSPASWELVDRRNSILNRFEQSDALRDTPQ